MHISTLKLFLLLYLNSIFWTNYVAIFRDTKYKGIFLLYISEAGHVFGPNMLHFVVYIEIVFRRIRKFLKTTINIVVSGRPSAWKNSVPPELIFMKFQIWIFFSKKSFEKTEASLTSDTNNGKILPEHQYTFWSHLAQFFVKWEWFQTIQGLSKRFEHLLLWPPTSPDLAPCDFFPMGIRYRQCLQTTNCKIAFELRCKPLKGNKLIIS